MGGFLKVGGGGRGLYVFWYIFLDEFILYYVDGVVENEYEENVDEKEEEEEEEL